MAPRTGAASRVFPEPAARRLPLWKAASFPRPARVDPEKIDEALPRAAALLRRCREHCAAGDLVGAWQSMTHAAWRVTASAQGAHAPGRAAPLARGLGTAGAMAPGKGHCAAARPRSRRSWPRRGQAR